MLTDELNSLLYLFFKQLFVMVFLLMGLLLDMSEACRCASNSKRNGGCYIVEAALEDNLCICEKVAGICRGRPYPCAAVGKETLERCKNPDTSIDSCRLSGIGNCDGYLG